MEPLEKFLLRYIGVPYYTFDCWDITKLFYLEILDIDFGLMLDYGTPANDKTYRKKISKVIEMQKSKFVKVDTLEFGDIILFNILGITAHVGVYIGDKKFLHSIREVGCAVESLKKWERKIEGYYRWPKQDCIH